MILLLTVHSMDSIVQTNWIIENFNIFNEVFTFPWVIFYYILHLGA